MISIKHSGNFNKTERFLRRAPMSKYLHIFEKYGRIGVNELIANTPIDSGETAKAWEYVIQRNRSGVSITWTNSNMVNGVPIVILLQYGHGTGNGGYVQGRDFINPTMKPIFDGIINDIWREVQSS